MFSFGGQLFGKDLDLWPLDIHSLLTPCCFGEFSP